MDAAPRGLAPGGPGATGALLIDWILDDPGLAAAAPAPSSVAGGGAPSARRRAAAAGGGNGGVSSALSPA
jgi:hypothetical protein